MFKKYLIICCLLFVFLDKIIAGPTDNEFAEFEVADEEVQQKVVFDEPAQEVEEQDKPKLKTKVIDEEEFPEEEFENFDRKAAHEETSDDSKTLEIKPLTFADIPSHFRSNWSSYQVEALALVLISIYILNYVYGKMRNHTIAYKWFTDNLPLLQRHFALAGDDGTSTELEGGHLIKDTDCSAQVWCSGRVGCQGMLTQIKLVKRQDLLGVIMNLFKPKSDTVIHKIDLDAGEMDSFVMILGQKKSVSKAYKDLADLNTYTAERRNAEKFGLSNNFALYAEIAESISAILDPTTVHFLSKYDKYIDFIHISDQYTGAKLQEGETYTKLPETTPTLIFSFVLHEDTSDETNRALLNFVFYLLEKIRRYRLSKEGKNKADKKRQIVEETFLKTTHAQRQEQAQARREEKAKTQKQRMLEEEDPEKQRALEDKIRKKEAKMRQPKMKQLKIK